MNGVTVLQMCMQHARQWMAGTMNGVTDEQAHHTPPGIANPLGATYAHLVVSEDMLVNGLLRGQPPLAATSWEGKTGLSEPMPWLDRWAEYGPWTRRVQIDLDALRAYAQAVFDNTDAYIASLSEEDLERKIDMSAAGMGEVPVAWVIGRLLIGHIDNECGEIACLKGIQGVRGYPG